MLVSRISSRLYTLLSFHSQLFFSHNTAGSIPDHLLIENQTDPVTQVAERGDTQGHHPLHAATAVQGPAQETHVSVTGQEADLDQDTGHHTEGQCASVHFCLACA